MNAYKKGLSLVFATAIISGFSIFINSLLVQTMSSDLFTFLKNSVVAIFVIALLYFWKQAKELKTLSKNQWLQLLLIGLIGGSIPFILFFKGLSMTSGTTGAFLHKTMFVYVGILASIFLKEKMNLTWYLGALALILGNAIFLKLSFASFETGHLLILIATLFWAVENTISKHILKNISANIVIFGRMFFGAMFLIPYLIFTSGFSKVSEVSGMNILGILLASALLFAYVLTWYNGLKYVPVSTATSILLLGSPITTLLSFIFLEKTITTQQFSGTAFLVLGIIFVISSLRKTQFSEATLSTT